MTTKTCNNCGRVFATQQDFLRDTYRWRISDLEDIWFNCSCGSTLLLRRDKTPWYSPTLHMSQAGRSAFTTLGRRREIPHIQSTILHLAEQLRDPEVDVAAVVGLIRRDPILAANTLTIANNLCRASGQMIESIEHAVVYVGRATLAELVITASIKAIPLPTRVFSQETFWHEAVVVGAVAEHLATHFGSCHSPDEAYLAGSLCNIGKIIAALCIPDETDRIATMVNSVASLQTWQKAEADYEAADHTILGEVGAVLWGFPPYVTEACRHHHRLPRDKRYDPKTSQLNGIIAYANQIAHWVLLQPHRLSENMIAQLNQYFGVSDTFPEQVVEKVTAMLRDPVTSKSA